jgi:alpha-glucosidase
MIKDFSAENIHTILITDLHIANLPKANYKPYDEGIAGDHFVKSRRLGLHRRRLARPLRLPRLHPKASRDWWGTLYADFVHRGVCRLLERHERARHLQRASKTMPDEIVHRIDDPETGFTPRNATHLEIHNIFGMKNSPGTYEGLRLIAPDTRPFVLTRATYAGGQRYAATWTGDNSSTWNHLRQTTPQLLNLGLSGFALAGADVGGFAGSPQPDLLTKWLEVAAFQPIDRDHTSAKAPTRRSPGKTAHQRPQHPPPLHRRALPPHALPLHHRRRDPAPACPSSARSSSNSPTPPPTATPRPRHPERIPLRPRPARRPSPYPDEIDDYPAVLPPVGWYNWWTGEPIKTGVHAARQGNDNITNTDLQITLHPSLDTLPVFARAGSIIPVQPLTQSTSEKPAGPLTLRVYPPMRAPAAGDAPCEGSLYLDDGTSYAYQKGDYLRLKFTCAVTRDSNGTPAGITVKISSHEGTYTPWWTQYKVEIYGPTKPATSATANGNPIPTTYDSEHHHIAAVVSDDLKGFELLVRLRDDNE